MTPDPPLFLLALKKLAPQCDPDKLRHCSIIILGAGAVGAIVAETFVKFHIGKLILFDWDKEEQIKMERNFFENSQVEERPKRLDELVGKLGSLDSPTLIKSYNFDITVVSKFNKFVSQIKYGNLQEGQIDLVLDCTNNLTVQECVNIACTEQNQQWMSFICKTPVNGMIQFFSPGKNGCFSCPQPSNNTFDTQQENEENTRCPEAFFLPSSISILAGTMSQTALKVLLKFSPLNSLIHYDAFNDSIQSTSNCPLNLMCSNKACRQRQEEVRNNNRTSISTQSQTENSDNFIFYNTQIRPQNHLNNNNGPVENQPPSHFNGSGIFGQNSLNGGSVENSFGNSLNSSIVENSVSVENQQNNLNGSGIFGQSQLNNNGSMENQPPNSDIFGQTSHLNNNNGSMENSFGNSGIFEQSQLNNNGLNGSMENQPTNLNNNDSGIFGQNQTINSEIFGQQNQLNHSNTTEIPSEQNQPILNFIPTTQSNTSGENLANNLNNNNGSVENQQNSLGQNQLNHPNTSISPQQNNVNNGSVENQPATTPSSRRKRSLPTISTALSSPPKNRVTYVAFNLNATTFVPPKKPTELSNSSKTINSGLLATSNSTNLTNLKAPQPCPTFVPPKKPTEPSNLKNTRLSKTQKMKKKFLPFKHAYRSVGITNLPKTISMLRNVYAPKINMTAMILAVNKDKMFYFSCRKKCRVSIIKIHAGRYTCPQCGEHDKAFAAYCVEIKIADFTGISIVKLYDTTAKQLFGGTSAWDMKQIKDKNPISFNSLTQKCLYQFYDMEVHYKFDQNNQKMERICERLAPCDLGRYQKMLENAQSKI